MSILFNKVIDGRQFNFQPIEFGEESGYHVDVKDDENTRWEFRIFRVENIWKIEAEMLPSWIHDVELTLSAAIDEHE